MKPKRITRTTFLMGVGGAAALAAFGARATAQAARPNVLLVLDDDHPPYMMDPMPVVRRRIRDVGVDLYNGAADIPLCGPARVSVLTGLSVTTHRCDDNSTYGDFRDSPLGLEKRTVARFLKDAGYRTAHFGKYVNGKGPDGPPAPHWDRWCLIEGSGGGDSAKQVNEDGEVYRIGGKPSMWAAARLADFVRNHAGGGPWFAQYCPTIPHAPYEPTPESEHLYDGADRDVPSTNEGRMGDKPAWMRDLPKVELEKIRRVIEGKKEELADLDRRCMKPVLDALDGSGQLGNTVVFFTSDNGYMAGEHRLQQKDHPYWESAEVPFFARGPGVASGARSLALVSHVDLAPTICELAGVSPALLEADGRSMAAGLSSGSFGPWRERMLTSGSDDVGPEQNPGGSNDPSGRWWLLAEGDKRFILRENGAKELYWMGSDPYQNRSRHDDADPALIRRLTDTVEAMRRASGDERRALET
jgi:arylsulfatase A-like enzyme